MDVATPRFDHPPPASGVGGVMLASLSLLGGWLLRFRGFLVLFFAGVLIGFLLRGCHSKSELDVERESAAETKVESKGRVRAPDLFTPVREAPKTFKRDTYLPKERESAVSGAITAVDFSAGRDLVYVEDDRVWWESDHDGDTDDECDHSMHAALEIPFRRLVNLLIDAGWQPRVQEAYRATGTHASRSLHKQGRALDITVDRLGEPKLLPSERVAAYEELAKLAWQAGFDWVYFEHSAGGGSHVHASVRADGLKMSDFEEKRK